MELVTYRIEGISAVLMNSPAQMRRTDDGTVGAKKIPSIEDEAEKAAYRMNGTKSQLFLPSIHFRSAIIGACTGMKIDKRAARSVVSGSVFLTEEECPLISAKTGKAIKNYEIDVRRAVIQRQGIMRARPRIDDWATHVTFEIDTDFINPDALLDLLNRAGKISGVGDYRPAKTGPFGRFTATRVAA